MCALKSLPMLRACLLLNERECKLLFLIDCAHRGREKNKEKKQGFKMHAARLGTGNRFSRLACCRLLTLDA